ncbi:hypothetical protein [Bradyrhizobium sp.]|uniref:hypothetical protein n=1 Tax=Bradyrhizobium sp. TaxID=376 RepID=UPI00403764E6
MDIFYRVCMKPFGDVPAVAPSAWDVPFGRAAFSVFAAPATGRSRFRSRALCRAGLSGSGEGSSGNVLTIGGMAEPFVNRKVRRGPRYLALPPRHDLSKVRLFMD